MTDVTTETQDQTELEKLKETATELGIEFHPNIGLDKLKERIDAAFPKQAVVEEQEVEEVPSPTELAAQAVPTVSAEALQRAVGDAALADIAKAAETPVVDLANETKDQRRYRLRKEATALIRVNVLNMNPFRKEWEGDTYCVGNGVIGTIKRYVPFGVDWHVEQALLNVMQERKCVVYTTKKDRESGQNVTIQRQIKELQIAILPPLTEQERKDLAQRQAMASGTQADED